MVRTLALVMLLAAMIQPCAAAEITCKKSPALTGQCRMVKGSLGLTSGVGVTVVAEDGTKTIIKAPPDSNADIATPVMQNWLYWQSQTGSMRTRITGTFELCPLPSQINAAGIKDYGCINKGIRIAQDKAVSVN
ncbi:MAG: hypothetical protein H0U98_03055 [Alphaproteobacteria bacterium]|nr:hypothetical protein [Alphaproteobacteria bacterium]